MNATTARTTSRLQTSQVYLFLTFVIRYFLALITHCTFIIYCMFPALANTSFLCRSLLMIIMILSSFTLRSFVSRIRQPGGFFFTVETAMGSTRCHAPLHLRLRQALKPTPVSSSLVISGILDSGILHPALWSPSLGPINWHVRLVVWL
jgi:hypothetical protein